MQYIITTPIFYVNGAPHIGHAYTMIISDIIARSIDMHGMQVKFTTGTDEHGDKIARSAEANKIDCKDFVDMNANKFINMMKDLNIFSHTFTRTTSAHHKAVVIQVWNKLEKYLYKDVYKGWYSVVDESFYSDDEVEHIDGKVYSIDTKSEVEHTEQESWFFKLSMFRDQIIEYYKNNVFQSDASRAEMENFMQDGLHDLSVSRVNNKWGIEVPNDSKHTIYVWLDALVNYITAITNDVENMKAIDIHVLGKDICKFHAIYWIAILLALEAPLPKKLFVHGWIISKGVKMSKSLGNVIDYNTLLERYGSDGLRYCFAYLFADIKDINVSIDITDEIYNSHLADSYGNLVSRVFGMCVKNGYININSTQMHTKDDNFYSQMLEIANSAIHDYKNNKIRHATYSIMDIVRHANTYIQNNAPWAMNENDFISIMYCCLNIIRNLALLFMPIMPNTSKAILHCMHIENDNSFEHIFTQIQSAQIQKGDILFPKVQDE